MSIQSALNSMLTTVGYLGGIGRGLSYQKETAAAAQTTAAEAKAQTEQLKHQSELQRKWFGEDETPSTPTTPEEQQIMEEGAMAEELYNKQREKAIINYLRDSRIEAKEDHKKLAQRKEYLKKPRKLNRHGILYEEVMK